MVDQAAALPLLPCRTCGTGVPPSASFCPSCGTTAPARPGPQGDRPNGAMPVLPGYTVLERLGAGGSSIVYRARQDNLQRDVAVKLIRQEVDDAAVWRRFEREARIIAALSGHPHVVTVYDVGRTDRGEPFLVTELLDRGSLADILARQGPLDVESVVAVGRAVASALSAAHERGILHRDVKPGNVLVDSHRQIKLGDFGVARLMAGHTQTTTASVAFTPEHVAPEVLRGEPEGPASDVYGLGSTLMTALTGRSPFARRPDERVEALMWRKLAEPAPAPPASAPPALARLLSAALATDPEQRPSLRELGAELAALSPDRPPRVEPAALTVRREPQPTGPTARAVLPPVEPPPADEGLEADEGSGDGAGHGRWLLLASIAVVVVFLAGVAVFAGSRNGGDSEARGSAVAVPTTTPPSSADPAPDGDQPVEEAPATVDEPAAGEPGVEDPPASQEPPTTPAPPPPAPAPAPEATTTTARPTTPASTPPPSRPAGRGNKAGEEEEEAVAFVQDYYDAVNAGRYEEAWSRLSPAFRTARSLTFERYVNYWRSTSIDVRDVRVTATDGDTRQVRFDARYTSGNQVVREANELTLRRADNGQFVITDQRIVG